MNSFSQAGQDAFALAANNYKRQGYFLDLGSNEPFVCSNSAALELYFDWRGVLVDFVPYLVDKCRAQRKNPCFCYDLEQKSATEILQENGAPNVIDYLSFDLDGENPRAKCLESLDFSLYKFNCITFEHDFYLEGAKIRDYSRAFFAERGMKRVFSDVVFNGCVFEDWYVAPEIVKFDAISSNGEDYRSIISKIQSLPE